jgi:hypothetical protein
LLSEAILRRENHNPLRPPRHWLPPIGLFASGFARKPRKKLVVIGFRFTYLSPQMHRFRWRGQTGFAHDNHIKT